jgi:hypothetical protein
VLFKTLDERRDAILRYGSGNYVVESFATHILPIMNGAFKVTCCLSEKPYYGVFNREIYELPKSSPEYTTEAMQRHNITSDMLQTSDVFIVETILKQNYVGKTQPVSHEVKIIDRSQINVDEPIIFGNTGIVLFPTREAAQLWINNYSASIEQYLIDKAFEVVEDSHREDLEQFVKETKEDKHDMTMMFLAIGGSGIAGVLVDALLKLAVEKRNEKQGGEGGGGSSFLPTLGVIAGIGVIGLIAYLIWKNHHDKEEEQKKVAREQKEARLYRSKRKTI